MKVTAQIHKALPAREILDNYSNYSSYFDLSKNMKGIYFHIYKASSEASIPFYIGISNNVFERNYDHLQNYINGSYWLVKDPEELKTLECFKIDSYDRNDFFQPIPKSNLEERKPSVEKLLDDMWILFSRVIPENKDAFCERILIEQVERQLQDKLVESLKIDPSWVGRTGSNRGGGLDIITHNLTIEYTSNEIPRLKHELLL